MTDKLTFKKTFSVFITSKTIFLRYYIAHKFVREYWDTCLCNYQSKMPNVCQNCHFCSTRSIRPQLSSKKLKKYQKSEKIKDQIKALANRSALRLDLPPKCLPPGWKFISSKLNPSQKNNLPHSDQKW